VSVVLDVDAGLAADFRFCRRRHLALSDAGVVHVELDDRQLEPLPGLRLRRPAAEEIDRLLADEGNGAAVRAGALFTRPADRDRLLAERQRANRGRLAQRRDERRLAA